MNDGDGEQSARQYDAMAVDYAADNAESPYNEYYERPSTISLLGDVSGQRVLEVGCGAGALTAWLVEHAAEVTAFDVSGKMVALTRTAVGDRARIEIGDLGQPLSYQDNCFNVVVASLVLHYVKDWHQALCEFRRVLVPDGAVVMSTHHPTMDWKHSPDDYFSTKQVTERWRKGDGEFNVTFWRRPLTAMTHAIASSGFVIEELVEPEPRTKLRDLNPSAYEQIRTKPRFLFFRLRADDRVN